MPEIRVQDQRPSCILCGLKHLARARGELLETRLGYSQHFWYALGEMSLAETEIVNDYPGLAQMIRSSRKRLESDPFFSVPFDTLVNTVAAEGRLSVDDWLREAGKETLQ